MSYKLLDVVFLTESYEKDALDMGLKIYIFFARQLDVALLLLLGNLPYSHFN